MKTPFKWLVARGDEGSEEYIVRELGVDPVIARLLVNRGIRSPEQARAWLEPSLGQLFDPFLMESASTAVERILTARDSKEKVVIYGDFDADGLTGTAILIRFFREIGLKAGHYIPDRVTESHGLREEALLKLKSGGATLVITVDNATNDVEAIDYANSIGMDVIITDHHKADGPAPKAVAILNPSLADCQYPFKELSGAGVAFKLCMAIRSELYERGVEKKDLPNLQKYLDLAALGTIADCSPLTGEGRVIVKHGLRELSITDKVGLVELKSTAMIDSADVTARDVGFELAPRINSASRMGNAEDGLNLMITESRSKARELARHLNEQNAARKKLQNETFEQARQMTQENGGLGDERAIALCSDQWHEGIIGIVASKLVDEFRVPVIITTFRGGETGKGSGRSIPGFDLHGSLKACDSQFDRFGGHEGAVGFAIKRERFPQFREMFLSTARETISGQELAPTLKIDCEVEPGRVDLEFLDQLNALEPFGEGNRAPVFLGKGVSFCAPPKFMGDERRHVRLAMAGEDQRVELVGFGMGDFFREVDTSRDKFNIVYTPERNVWKTRVRAQLRLLDIRKA